MAKVRLEMSLVDYNSLLYVLNEIAKYRGTTTASMANSLMSKIRSGLIKVDIVEVEE